MNHTISLNNIHLISSFEINKKDFERELIVLREQHPECHVWKRSIKSLTREWAAHNAFHSMGILRNKTADTDLNWPQNWLTRIGYSVVGAIVWPFIK